MPIPSRALPGTLFGKYRIEAFVGRGAMGEVYRAYDADLQRLVALKMLGSGGAEDPKAIERFQREARAAARLQHPRIVTVYDLGQSEGELYIVMEYLQGRSLDAALKAEGLSMESTIEVLIQVLEGLEYAHGHDVVHRDVKPGNIHILPDDSVKILDFGLARILTAASLRPGSVVGTPDYIAPELLRGQGFDRRSDIYSAGVMAYLMLAGRYPFEGTMEERLRRKCTEPPPPMDVPWSREFPELERIVGKALEMDSGLRYATAGEMARDLSAFLESERVGIALHQAEPGPAVWSKSKAATTVPPPSSTDVPTQSVRELGLSLLGTRTEMPRLRRRTAWLGFGLLTLAVGLGSWHWTRFNGSGAGPGPSVDRGTPRPAPSGPGRLVPQPEAEAHSTGGPPTRPRAADPQPSLCVEPANVEATSADLAVMLAEELRREGTRVRPACSSGDTRVRVRADLSLRPAPFGSSSAFSVDYVGVLELRPSAPAEPQRFDFAGHAMEFGENVARAGALRELVVKMTDTLGDPSNRAARRDPR